MVTTTSSKMDENASPEATARPSVFINSIFPSSTSQQPTTLSPGLEFLTADTTLFVLLTLSLALYPTVRYWNDILAVASRLDIEQEETSTLVFGIPLVFLGFVASWMLVGFAAGVALHDIVSVKLWNKDLRQEAQAETAAPPSLVEEERTVPTPEVPEPEPIVEPPTIRRRHRFFGKIGRKKDRSPKRKPYQFGDVTRTVLRQHKALWTNLNSRSRANSKQPPPAWTRNINPTKNGDLVQLLVQRRQSQQQEQQRRKTLAAAAGETKEEPSTTPTASVASAMGAFDLTTTTADTFRADEGVTGIEPLFQLRGIDGFLAEELESNIATHPWLIEQGLRDVPTCVINVLSKYGHILIYFAMPEWVADWDNALVHQDSDTDRVKAFKTFLSSEDDYRNCRLKMIPSLVDGPMAIKMLVPNKKELLLNFHPYLQVRWNKHAAETTSSGRRLHPALEVTCDCVSNRTMQSMTGIVKRNLERMSIDLAAVVTQPAGSDTDEEELCVGLFRLHYLDVSSCPYFPDRVDFEAEATGEDPDVVRAEQLAAQ